MMSSRGLLVLLATASAACASEERGRVAGAVTWVRTFDDGDFEAFRSVGSPDGHIAITGKGSAQTTITMLDGSGDTAWAISLPRYAAPSVAATPGGEMYLAAIGWPGDDDVSLARVGADGEILWTKLLSRGVEADAPRVAALASGGVAVLGLWARGESVDLGGGPLVRTEGQDAYFGVVAAYDLNGEHLWSGVIPDLDTNGGDAALVTRSDDSVVVQGGNNAGLRETLVAVPAAPAVDERGELEIAWRQEMAVNFYEPALAVDAEDRTYLAVTATALDDTGDEESYVLRFLPDGALDWTAERCGDEASQVAVRESGVVTISTEDALDRRRTFLAAIDGDGHLERREIIDFGSGGESDAQAAFVDGGGNLVLAGRFQRRLTIDGEVVATGPDGVATGFVLSSSPP